MDEVLKEIFEKFGIMQNQYYSNDQWIVSVRPKQVTLGATILIAKRHVMSIGDLTNEELLAMGDAIRNLEQKLLNSFNYEKINYLMLMMADPQLHFHVIPRYSENKIFAGITWQDPAWPKAPDMGSVISEPGAADAVRDALT